MSEVRRLMRQIELEYEAARRGVDGFAMTASHDFINARLESVWKHREELAKCLGDEGATKAIYELYVKVIG